MSALVIVAASCTAHIVLHNIHKNTAVCLTPKLASSSISDYLLWSEVGPPEACRFNPTHSLEYTKFCPTPGNSSRYRYNLYPKPLVANRETQNTFDVYVVPTRDPWTRLLSGFKSKFYSACNSSRMCFKRQWVKATPTSMTYNNLEAYLSGITATPIDILNPHFKPQHTQCLGGHFPKNTMLMDLDHDYNMTVLANHWNLKPYRTVIKNGRYTSWNSKIIDCYKISPTIRIATEKFLDNDYRALKKPNPLRQNITTVCPLNNSFS